MRKNDRMNVWKQIPIIILTIGTILDLFITTLIYLESTKNPLKPFTEINPLYHWLGNYWLFLIVNVLLIAYLMWIYHKTNLKKEMLITKYILFTLLLLTGIIRILASINNYAVLNSPDLETIEQAQQVTQQVNAQATTTYTKLALAIIIIPALLIIINFILFTKAHKLKIDDQGGKK